MIQAGCVHTSSASRLEKRPGKKDAWMDLVHTGPGTPMGSLLRAYWQPMAVASDLAWGSTMPVRVMGEDLTLYRGESGRPYIVAARCAHRSTLLHTGWVEEDCVRCFFHGWKYDGSGQCIEMPAEDPSFPPKVKIVAYPAQEYAGLIFAFMGDGTPPELPHKAELDRDYGVRWALSTIWPCNWFQRIENMVDAAHVPFTHRDARLGDRYKDSIPVLEYEETEWGIRQKSHAGTTEANWPNCNHFLAPMDGLDHRREPYADVFNWFVPVDEEHTAQFTALHAPVSTDAAHQLEEQLTSRPLYKPEDHHEELFRGQFPADHAMDLVVAQDYLAQVAQGTIVDRSQERLGKSDAGVIFLRRIFRRELDAIKKGRTGKQWRPMLGFARLPRPPEVPPAPDP